MLLLVPVGHFELVFSGSDGPWGRALFAVRFSLRDAHILVRRRDADCYGSYGRRGRALFFGNVQSGSMVTGLTVFVFAWIGRERRSFRRLLLANCVFGRPVAPDPIRRTVRAFCLPPLRPGVVFFAGRVLCAVSTALTFRGHWPAIGGAPHTYFERERKGMTGGCCIRSSASQMGQDHTSFKLPRSLEGSACSTRLCVVHLAVGRPLRPLPWSSSIIFGVPPSFEDFPFTLESLSDTGRCLSAN